MIKANERLPVIDVEDDAGDPTVPQEVNPLLTPDVLARRARVGKKLREEHIQRTVKTPGARRRQIRFKLFSSVSREPLITANEQATLADLIRRFRGHAARPILNGVKIPDMNQPYVSPHAMAALEQHAGDLKGLIVDLETEGLPPADGYVMPNSVINRAMASFYARMIIGKAARKSNPKLPPWPPSEADLDMAEAERRKNHPMDITVGLPQWLSTVGQGRSIPDLCKAAFDGG